jgi:hypothetical protein
MSTLLIVFTSPSDQMCSKDTRETPGAVDIAPVAAVTAPARFDNRPARQNFTNASEHVKYVPPLRRLRPCSVS